MNPHPINRTLQNRPMTGVEGEKVCIFLGRRLFIEGVVQLFRRVASCPGIGFHFKGVHRQLRVMVWHRNQDAAIISLYSLKNKKSGFMQS
ncbi:hypothetical protein BDR07DRAFT_237726 [Suillus spraguei]|nr:hypothetical protein BDR07DRAFT_237726 [Suillus spraguei]